MTTDSVEAEDLKYDVSDRLFVMDKWRYHPGVERLRGIGGDLGDLIGLHTKHLGWATLTKTSTRHGSSSPMISR